MSYKYPSGGIIESIEPRSIADELGWKPGDEILAINNNTLHDVIDFRFYSSEEHIIVTIRRGDQIVDFEIEKDADEPLGVDFKDILFDGVRLCGAHCIFCFVDQLPRGLRRSLYLKDDDFRLSFLHGNFITLANLSENDLQRIVTQRLSPLYVSVHTTDHKLRERMLGRKAPDILAQIDFLARGRIELHAQIVLCPGINDGDYLFRTIEDLAARYPAVQSVAIVPVGLTAYRQNKTLIGSVDAQYSTRLLNIVKQKQKRFMAEKGTRLIWAADEFYLCAGRPVPKSSAYEGFPQIENGVGLVRTFKDSAARAKRIIPSALPKPMSVSIATGKLAAPLIEEWVKTLHIENLRVQVIPIENTLFGCTVTVAGLLAGRDIIDQLSDRDLGDVLFIPSVAVRDGVFLDDVSLSDVSSAVGCQVVSIVPQPYQFIKRIIELSRNGGRVD
jgi:putative radical SAM enzyme (TIGR03279 family)